MKRRAPRSSEVVVFGEAIWDLFPRRAGESVATRAVDVRHPGGAPANVARTLARLGIATSLVTALGEDALGDGLLTRLRDDGVSVEHVVRLPARTAVTFVDVARDGARSFLFYRYPSADMQLESSMLDARAFTAAWLHLGTSSLARSPSREATRRALELALAAGARISIDVNARRHLWPSTEELVCEAMPIVERADVVKVSEEDLGLLGFSPDVEGGRALHARRGDGITCLTLAERGAVAWWGNTFYREKAPRARTVDVTGAGDAFVAGALSTIVRGDPTHREALLRRALSIGCTLGSRAVTRLGATTALRDLRAVARRAFAPLDLR